MQSSVAIGYMGADELHPDEAIKFRMEQHGLTARDREAYIGPSGRVSEILDRKRPLNLPMVEQLHGGEVDCDVEV